MSETEGLREAIARAAEVVIGLGPERRKGCSLCHRPIPCPQHYGESIADAVLALPQVAELRGKVERVEALADPEVMARAMWKSSGLREDLIDVAAVPAASAVAAALASSPTTHEGDAT